MAIVTFDTFKFAQRLKTAGIPEIEIKAHVDALLDITQDNSQLLATKSDLMEVETRLEAKINHVEMRLEAKIDKVETSLNGKISLLQWMLGFVLAGVATLILHSFF